MSNHQTYSKYDSKHEKVNNVPRGSMQRLKALDNQQLPHLCTDFPLGISHLRSVVQTMMITPICRSLSYHLLTFSYSSALCNRFFLLPIDESKLENLQMWGV